MPKIKERAGKLVEQEITEREIAAIDLVRACYAEKLLDRAEHLLDIYRYQTQSLEASEDPDHGKSTSGYINNEEIPGRAWNPFAVGAFSECCEKQVIRKNLMEKLSEEAREVVSIILTTPEEVTKALMKITITGGERPETLKNPKLETIYHPQRVRRYFNRKFGVVKTDRIWNQLGRFFKHHGREFFE